MNKEEIEKIRTEMWIEIDRILRKTEEKLNEINNEN